MGTRGILPSQGVQNVLKEFTRTEANTNAQAHNCCSQTHKMFVPYSFQLRTFFVL